MSDFALKNALPAGGTDVTQIDGTNGVVVNGSGTGPTVTLGLSSSYLETLGNSIYPQIAATNTLTGKNTYSAGKLFIGTAPVLSTANVLASSPITVAASGNNVTIGLSDSGLLTLGNSVYAQLGAANTFSKIQTFASDQTFPGTVSLSANNSFTGSNTFSKAITFASGQTFPGTGAGTITGITTSSPLSGSGTSGSVALSLNTSSLESTLNGVYPQLSASNTFSGSNTFSKAITFASGQTFPGTGNGTITGVTAGTGLTGGGSSGGVTLNVDVNGLESTYNSVYAGLSADNNFTGQNSIDFGDDGTGLNVEVGNSRSANFYSNSANGFDTVDIISSNANDDLLVAYNSDSGGSCIIDGNGDLSCTGSLAVTNSLGDRKVETYGVQSAENWIEDFGSGQLIAGSSHISLEPTFAATVNTAAEYHVFLTPRGDSEGLYVANAGPDGFDVKESRGGHTTLAFDYRIVARRKGFETVRMRDITAKTKAHQARREELDAAAKRSRPAVTPHVSAKP